MAESANQEDEQLSLKESLVQCKWNSYGSEAEVEDEKRENSRKKMKFIFKKRLKCFGGPLKLDDSTLADEKRNAIDFPPFEDKAFNIFTFQLNKFVQHVAQPYNVVCQTEVRPKKNIGTQYTSRELSEVERDAILHSDGLSTFLKTVIPRLFDVFEQQQLVDAFSED